MCLTCSQREKYSNHIQQFSQRTKANIILENLAGQDFLGQLRPLRATRIARTKAHVLCSTEWKDQHITTVLC